MTKVFLVLGVIAMFFPIHSTHAAVSDLALTFDTNIRTINMSSEQEAKIQQAEEKIKKIIASEEFKEKILNHKYLGKKRFADNKGLTNSQIYQKIIDGAERLFPVANNAMDMEVKLYYENSKTVGYTMSKSINININKKFFNKYSVRHVSRNMMHEWLHKLGFSHDVKATLKRRFSVPYAVGRIVEKLGKRY